MITLSRNYAGYSAGSIVELNNSTELALIASGGGVAAGAGANPTPGNVTTTENGGNVGIAAGGTSVIISNPNIRAQSKVFACITSAVDATATYITRVACIDGQVTITVNAATTGQVNIDWAHLNANGSLSNPQ